MVASCVSPIQRVWDELDAWHSRLTALEVEVQDLSEEQPEQAHVLMDQLIQPLQLYQDTAQQAEQRTAFLSRVTTLPTIPQSPLKGLWWCCWTAVWHVVCSPLRP